MYDYLGTSKEIKMTKKIVVILGIVILIIGFISLTKEKEQVGLHFEEFPKELYNLEGVWKTKKISFTEIWSRDKEGLKGVGEYTRNGKVLFSEKLFINKKDKYISYTTTGGNDYPTDFVLTNSTESKFVFENKEHDSPQKITYELWDENHLTVTLSTTEYGMFESEEIFDLYKEEKVKTKDERSKYHNVALLVMNGTYNTELTAPMDIFHHTKFREGIKPMNVFTIANTNEQITTFEGLHIKPDYNYKKGDFPNIDILVIPAAEHNLDTDLDDNVLLKFVSDISKKADFVVSHCDGAFVLAKSGVLNGLESTTFPGDVEEYKRKFPNLKVHEDVLFVHDGKFITSAGGAKSFEASLYLCELLYGKQVAEKLAKGMVIDWDLDNIDFVKVEQNN